MSRWLPDCTEERWLTLASRYPSLAAAAPPDGAGNWKTARLRSRLGFFLLGLFAGQQAGSLIILLLFPSPPLDGPRLPLFLVGMATLGVAEVLIVRRRLFHSGLEEGLWLAGLTSIFSAVLPQLLERHMALSIAIPAAALVLAGLRLLNPLGVVAGAVLSSGAVAAWIGSPWEASAAAPAAVWCLGIALIALALGYRTFTRPSRDLMLDYLVVAMPIAGFGWALAASPAPITLQSLAGPWYPQLLPVLLPCVGATACFVIGLRRRTHAPLVAALACKLCLAFALRDVTGLPWRWLLILWGALVLLACVALDRWLRQPRQGISTADVGDDKASTLFPDVARAAMLTPLQEPAAVPPYSGQGGGFGGGGASGRY